MKEGIQFVNVVIHIVMALTDGGTWHLYACVSRLLVCVYGVDEDADEGGGDEEEPTKLPVKAATVAYHEVDVAYEALHPCWTNKEARFMNAFCIGVLGPDSIKKFSLSLS